MTDDGSLGAGAVVGFAAVCLIAVGVVLIHYGETVPVVAGGMACVTGGFFGNAAFDLAGGTDD